MIIGAGYAGLIGGYVMPEHAIFERSPRTEGKHRALLRFRSPAVSELTGIEFKKVDVKKGIWDWRKKQFVAPSIDVCNQYAQKVIGRIEDRSIWRVDPVTRWIAPRDLYDQMADALGNRIDWAFEWVLSILPNNDGVISTAPLSVIACEKLDFSEDIFHASPVFVSRAKVPNCSVYQTIYFPHSGIGIYRASITGDELICEWTEAGRDFYSIEVCAHAFGIDAIRDLGSTLTDVEEQAAGKISPIDEATRKSLISNLTREKGIYSLGRYATWRNIMLDDVVHDAQIIKRLLNASEYDRKLAAL
jgi:hypothetical protein